MNPKVLKIIQDVIQGAETGLYGSIYTAPATTLVALPIHLSQGDSFGEATRSALMNGLVVGAGTIAGGGLAGGALGSMIPNAATVVDDVTDNSNSIKEILEDLLENPLNFKQKDYSKDLEGLKIISDAIEEARMNKDRLDLSGDSNTIDVVSTAI